MSPQVALDWVVLKWGSQSAGNAISLQELGILQLTMKVLGNTKLQTAWQQRFASHAGQTERAEAVPLASPFTCLSIHRAREGPIAAQRLCRTLSVKVSHAFRSKVLPPMGQQRHSLSVSPLCRGLSHFPNFSAIPPKFVALRNMLMGVEVVGMAWEGENVRPGWLLAWGNAGDISPTSLIIAGERKDAADC